MAECASSCFVPEVNLPIGEVHGGGHNREILTKRGQIKRKTLALRRKQNLNTRVA
jgi:hypothetical protein